LRLSAQAAWKSQRKLDSSTFQVYTKIVPMNSDSYPDAVDANLVGTYPADAKAGGGYVWDDVLEYRVWCCPERGAAEREDGGDYYYAFATYAEGAACFVNTAGAKEPLALIQQIEYIDEPTSGHYRHMHYRHMKELRIASRTITIAVTGPAY
jgi:hypothetical protein